MSKQTQWSQDRMYTVDDEWRLRRETGSGLDAYPPNLKLDAGWHG
ncbi:MAG: hypothetical protein OXE52_18120 [Chloroflexi bacterium]|nr:hypothetical protein [Chloroflexota bacterium]